VAFESDRTGKGEVWVVNADGSGLRRLTTTPREPSGWPRPLSVPLLWTTDGSQLVVRRPNGFQLVPLQPGGTARTICRLELPQALDARFVTPLR
jgi:Tol biopolymer transport system component